MKFLAAASAGIVKVSSPMASESHQKPDKPSFSQVKPGLSAEKPSLSEKNLVFLQKNSGFQKN